MLANDVIFLRARLVVECAVVNVGAALLSIAVFVRLTQTPQVGVDFLPAGPVEVSWLAASVRARGPWPPG